MKVAESERLLLRRLDDVDLGFALLSRFWGKGYAFEAASAVMAYGNVELGLSRIVAIVSKDNHPSAKLLEKLGFRSERLIRLQADGEALELYSTSIGATGRTGT